MVRMIKGGRELQVRDEEVTYYLGEGFKCIDKNGNEIEYHKPISYDEAMAKIKSLVDYSNGVKATLAEAQNRINQLETENKTLRAENDKLRKKTKE